MREQPKNLFLLYLVVILLVVGTTGYMMILQVDVIDALYMTVITISTVGYREIQDLDTGGKLFTMLIIISGLGIVAYAFSQLAVFLAEGEFRRAIRNKRNKRRLRSMKDHYIICGAGQTSVSLIDQFTRSHAEFVIIEENQQRCDELLNQGFTVIHGDATVEDTLLQARIESAKGLVSCLDTDAENVFTVLTARGMNSTMQIVSKAIEATAPQKLLKAGANNTISPNELGGNRMAFLMLRPQVISFLDTITRIGEDTLDLGEIEVTENSPLAGKLLKDAKIPEKTGLIVLAVKGKEGKSTFNPSSNTVLYPGVHMLVLGCQDQITKLQHMAEI
ncbi:MAG: potassium channel protein [Spirochaetia bacterium]|nr:potassium channel protein [Spirochaetia bacterium]